MGHWVNCIYDVFDDHLSSPDGKIGEVIRIERLYYANFLNRENLFTSIQNSVFFFFTWAEKSMKDLNREWAELYVCAYVCMLVVFVFICSYMCVYVCVHILNLNSHCIYVLQPNTLIIPYLSYRPLHGINPWYCQYTPFHFHSLSLCLSLSLSVPLSLPVRHIHQVWRLYLSPLPTPLSPTLFFPGWRFAYFYTIIQIPCRADSLFGQLSHPFYKRQHETGID